MLLNDLMDGRINFFTRVRHYDVVKAESLNGAANEPGRLFVVTDDRRWRQVSGPVQTRFEPLASGRAGRRAYSLYGERPLE